MITEGTWLPGATVFNGEWHVSVVSILPDNIESKVVALTGLADEYAHDYEEGVGNAQLIAAAPAMREALEDMIEIVDVNFGHKAKFAERLARAKAAIAKTKGEIA